MNVIDNMRNQRIEIQSFSANDRRLFLAEMVTHQMRAMAQSSLEKVLGDVTDPKNSNDLEMFLPITDEEAQKVIDEIDQLMDKSPTEITIPALLKYATALYFFQQLQLAQTLELESTIGEGKTLNI